jgi:hypothetical protein
MIVVCAAIATVAVVVASQFAMGVALLEGVVDHVVGWVILV